MSKKINIDSEKCIGCGICARTCKQSAIQMIDGKAVVTDNNSCDKIGNCLPVCPVNAISFVEDRGFTQDKDKTQAKTSQCYSSLGKDIFMGNSSNSDIKKSSQLRQWPVQIKLVLENASYFDNADLLISADCCAYSYDNFHNDFMKDKVTIIGCPKLDIEDYTQKLTNIMTNNNIKSVTVARMEVPCCGGIERATKNAVVNSNKSINLKIATITTDGNIL